jgi:MFS family permease
MLRKKTSWRATAPSILIVLNTFVWYILTYTVFSEILNGLTLPGAEKIGLFTVYYVGVAVTAILGSKLFSRARTKSLHIWLAMGALATFLLIFVPISGILVAALLAFFFGASVGIGLPSCLSYFADSTFVENRGVIGGITWSGVGFAVLLFAFLTNTVGQLETILALTVWRLLGSVSFLFLNRKRENQATIKPPSYLELIRKRGILLYLFPWVMISLINFAETPLVERVFGQDFPFIQLVGFVFIGIFATVGGAIADFAGRKRVVIAGFVMLGIEYAALSAFSDSPATLYLFLALDGITWGLLVSVFFMAIWGDIGENHEKEKYYVLGGLPYLLANFLYVLIKPYASDVPLAAAFSFASFFLFLAVLPLMYAPETLPEKHIRERELKSYIEKAKKEAEKAQQKEAETPQEENEDAEVEFETNQEDYEEILKEAEKYY